MKNYSFSEEAIANAIDIAKTMHEKNSVDAGKSNSDVSLSGCMLVSASCISVEVKDNHVVCLDLPLGFGSVCFPIPSFVPTGVFVEACISICTTWGLPTGIKVTFEYNGKIIVRQTFGKC